MDLRAGFIQEKPDFKKNYAQGKKTATQNRRGRFLVCSGLEETLLKAYYL